MAKLVGLGTVLKCSTAGTTTYGVTVGQIVSIDGPNASAADIDVTTLDSGSNFRQFKRGLVDMGELALQIAWDPSTTEQKALNALLRNGTTAKWMMVAPTTTIYEEFDGYVKGIGRSIALDAMTVSPVTIKVTADSTATLPWST